MDTQPTDLLELEAVKEPLFMRLPGERSTKLLFSGFSKTHAALVELSNDDLTVLKSLVQSNLKKVLQFFDDQDLESLRNLLLSKDESFSHLCEKFNNTSNDSVVHAEFGPSSITLILSLVELDSLLKEKHALQIKQSLALLEKVSDLSFESLASQEFTSAEIHLLKSSCESNNELCKKIAVGSCLPSVFITPRKKRKYEPSSQNDLIELKINGQNVYFYSPKKKNIPPILTEGLSPLQKGIARKIELFADSNEQASKRSRKKIPDALRESSPVKLENCHLIAEQFKPFCLDPKKIDAKENFIPGSYQLNSAMTGMEAIATWLVKTKKKNIEYEVTPYTQAEDKILQAVDQTIRIEEFEISCSLKNSSFEVDRSAFKLLQSVTGVLNENKNNSRPLVFALKEPQGKVTKSRKI